MLERLTRRPTPSTVRRLCLGALVTNVAIVVTGGAVRLTGSGLGCPTWPRCTDTSLVPTGEMGLHGAVEFGNRMLTGVLVASVAACLVATLRQSPRRPVLVRLSWALLAGIVAQALLGGATVLTGLHPLTVTAHFLLSMVLVAAATMLVERSGEPEGPARVVVRREMLLGARLLVGLAALTIVLGTIVTGSGPHSGDIAATDRLPIDPATATQLHADAVFALLGLTAALLLGLAATGAPARVRRRVVTLLAVALAQGGVGYVQYFTDLPVLLVGLHVLGATLLWVAAVRVVLATRTRDPAPSGPEPASTPVSAEA
ncbi:MAG: COX15/CtaA family protein [Actinomycetes bacterium]